MLSQTIHFPLFKLQGKKPALSELSIHQPVINSPNGINLNISHSGLNRINSGKVRFRLIKKLERIE
jgi:hypothetical protein